MTLKGPKFRRTIKQNVFKRSTITRSITTETLSIDNLQPRTSHGHQNHPTHTLLEAKPLTFNLQTSPTYFSEFGEKTTSSSFGLVAGRYDRYDQPARTGSLGGGQGTMDAGRRTWVRILQAVLLLFASLVIAPRRQKAYCSQT